MEESKRMPVLFIGHGSPMNAIEENEYTQGWENIAKELPRPKAILSVSAHWYTRGTRISDTLNPEMIYDMYGFPEELYQVKYPVQGAPELAGNTQKLISRAVQTDNSWGIDHGTWSVLVKMYPKADIPVYQLSVDRMASAEVHFEIGRELRALREQGVLILGSGNVVHNLGLYGPRFRNGVEYTQVEQFDNYIRDNILERNFEAAVQYQKAGKGAEHAVPIPDHYYPLLYVLGASVPEDTVSVYNNACTDDICLSMTSYLFK